MGRGWGHPPGGLCAACCLCLAVPAAQGAGARDPPPRRLQNQLFSVCPTGPTTPSPFFQFSHAAEARAPQDSKETVRGCLPI